MSGFNYRISVIPAGAIIDDRLTPRALQVLCLLGRHTDDNGWCSRSQVKMARELKCGRATIYDALELLYGTGWVERERNGRGGTRPEASEHPFAAYSYRVRLDRDDLPKRATPAETPPAEAVEGAAQAAGGAGIAAGGAALEPAPLELIPSEGIPSEPVERECARESKQKRAAVVAFLKRWPSAAVDSRAAIEREWEQLPDHELQSALDGIEPFLAELKKLKRSTIPAGATYLHERKWTGLAAADAPKEQTFVTFRAWSREWWAMVLARADRGEPIAFRVNHAKETGAREMCERADLMPPAEVIAALKSVPGNGDWMTAWRPWFQRRGAELPEWRENVWVFLPGPQPPDPGERALPAMATGPPT